MSDTIKIIENTEYAQNDFNLGVPDAVFATTYVALTPSMLEAIQRGQCVAAFDGEFSTFISAAPEEKVTRLSRESAEQICRQYFNKVGLFGGTEPCRVIGFHDDGEDFYYIALKWPRGGEPEKVYLSMVGGFDPVVGDYTQRLWDGSVPPVDAFEVLVNNSRIQNVE